MKPCDALLAEAGAHRVAVRGVRRGAAFEACDWVADEVPVALELNGIAHAVMLATPADLGDFALGFALSEGLIDDARELYGIDEDMGPDGITVRMEVSAAAFARMKRRRRALAGRTGCGLCGVESLAELRRPVAPLPRTGATFETPALARAMRELASSQPLNRATGAVHAAAWSSAQGEVRLLREDVGRHNALDKLVGAISTARIAAGTGFVAITSRASYEMVHKAAHAGVAVLAAVSAPTMFAIQTAHACGLTLAGFVRGDDLVVYSHPDRLALTPEEDSRCTSTR